MKKGILVAELLFAPVFAVQAENYYAVPLQDREVALGDEIILPATITGRVSSANSEHVVSFQVHSNYGNQPAVIYTNTGTGTTFRGHFKVFAVSEAGKSKKYTATVTGAVLDGAGYGTATIKKKGAVPVMVRAE